MKKILIFQLFFFLLTSLTTASEYDNLSNAFGAGKIDGEAGFNFRVDDEDDSYHRGDIGVSYLDFAFNSLSFNNFKFGFQFIAVGELWANDEWEDAFESDETFQRNSLLKEVYLEYSIPGIKTEINAGRKKFKKNPSMDGDSHQGIELKTKIIPYTKLYCSVINRWVNNATTDYDMDGIQRKWRRGDDVYKGASDLIYSVIADIEFDIFGGMIGFSPFWNYQNKVIVNYGLDFEFEKSLFDGFVLGMDGIFVLYDEETTSPKDEDARSFLVHTRLNYRNFEVGFGSYNMSYDVRVRRKAIGNDEFDPMEEGVYGGDPGDNTLWIDASYDSDPWEVKLVFGETDVYKSDDGCIELDIYLTWFMTKLITMELMFVNVDDNDSLRDYKVYAGTLHFNF